jgi:UDP-N-acetylmuramyl pentapeptide phosphotransferase/UDP-N-acetylglucosamine-1-phosphate transferase
VPWLILVGALALGLVGFIDDRKGLAAVLRLLAQAAVGAVVGAQAAGVGGALLGAGIFGFTVNVVNFMDGINGMSALSLAVWGVAALAIGTTSHHAALTFVGALVAGGSLGFLPWNMPHAKIFLGDVGSYVLGALVAGGLVLGWRDDTNLPILLAPLAISVSDTLFTLLWRLRRGEPVLEAHRSHVYQRLVAEHRLSHTAVAGIAASGSALITLMWVLICTPGALAGTVVVCATYLASPRLIGSTRKQWQQSR